MHMCPNCGNELKEDDIEKCPNCDFDFNDTLTCPQKVSNRCIHTQQVCDIQGLNFELCKTFLHKTGMMK